MNEARAVPYVSPSECAACLREVFAAAAPELPRHPNAPAVPYVTCDEDDGYLD